MTKYASAVFALVAAFTGVIGDTHESARAGIGGITSLGWAAIAVAVLSFAASLTTTYRDQVKINWQAEQRAKVRRVANQQVREAASDFIATFEGLLLHICLKHGVAAFDMERLGEDPTYTLDLLSNRSVQAGFEKVDVWEMDIIHPHTIWYKDLGTRASDLRESLNELAAKYSGYLDADALAAIEELRNDELLRFTFPILGRHYADDKQAVPMPVLDALGIAQYGWEPFGILLHRLRTIFNYVSDEPRAA